MKKNFYINIVLILFLISCEKKDSYIDNHYILLNDKKVSIENAIIKLSSGDLANSDNFRLIFYSDGVSFFKDQYGNDSIVYNQNAIRVYYWMYKPISKKDIAGEYIYRSGYNDTLLFFNQAGYLNNNIGSDGMHYVADSGIVRIKGYTDYYEVNFEFYSHDYDDQSKLVSLKGKYTDNIPIEYDN
jgi:hypothetical protein